MHISGIQIKNFKKLKDVTVPLNKDQSIFVGSNNSGKTSAFEAISKFLKKERNESKRKFSVYDFTIYNWNRINELLNELQSIKTKISTEKDVHNLLEESYEKQKELESLFPSLKIVIDVEEDELYRAIDLIPRLDNDISQVAVYQRFEPENYEELFERYRKACEEAEKMKELLHGLYNDKEENIDKVKESIWPKSFRDFLERDGNLHRYFTIRYYLANPSLEENEFLHDEVNEFSTDPLANIIEVDEINAQRGLTDDENNSEFKVSKRISSQFSRYHKRFNENIEDPVEHDGTLTYAKYYAEQTIGSNLKSSLTDLITPLESLGYPAFGSPNIDVEPVIDIIKTIENEGNILFNPHNSSDKDFLLPESSNGLGFQNLIYIFLKLQYFCHSRLDVEPEQDVKPLHIILIEEPEAHLHAQAQKVFIKKAIEIITQDQPDALHSQLFLSTHSSHVASESEFNNLLYFKREVDENNHIADVVHLSNVYLDPNFNYDRQFKKDKEDEQKLRNEGANERFVKKYLEVAEHDLFFADAIILIEGSAERILLPQMLKNYSNYLSSKYITFFEVGGAYGHLFFPWLRALERPTLIITDIDTVDINKEKKKTHTTTHMNKVTKNPTIGEWFKDSNVSIKQLVTCGRECKEQKNMRITYQYKNYGENNEEAYSRTFEDDFALTNRVFFKNMEKAKGLAKKYKTTFNSAGTVDESLTKELFESTDSTKSSFALDILFNELEQGTTEIPVYIKDGLDWLEEQLRKESETSGDMSEA